MRRFDVNHDHDFMVWHCGVISVACKGHKGVRQKISKYIFKPLLIMIGLQV